MTQSNALTIEQRRAILQQEINKYVKQDYRVVSQTDTTAQLVRPKKFSCLIAVLALLVVVIGFIIYLIYYASKKDDQIYIEVDENGKVRIR